MPRPTGVGRRQMGFAIALKFGAVAIVITKNPGYTVIVYKNPLPFSI
jgi:hypothetical protein